VTETRLQKLKRLEDMIADGILMIKDTPQAIEWSKRRKKNQKLGKNTKVIDPRSCSPGITIEVLKRNDARKF
jgi:hypothetical protein